MDIKKIILMTAIALAIIASVSAVSAGLFDGLMGESQQDNVVELDEITFNTTNLTEFNKTEKSQDGGYIKEYIDKNGSDYYVHVYNYDKLDDTKFYREVIEDYKASQHYDDIPKETIDDVVVYTELSHSPNHTGEKIYKSYVIGNSKNIIVDFWTKDPNEIVKMVSTLSFK